MGPHRENIISLEVAEANRSIPHSETSSELAIELKYLS